MRTTPIQISESQLAYSHPIDILHKINPELAGLIYADQSGILSKDILPLIANFRGLQSNEKINLLNNISRQYGHDISLEIARESERGASYREDSRERGMTERNRESLEQLSKLAEMRYKFDSQVYSDNSQTARYISDNEVRALETELQAQQETISFTKFLESETAKGLSKDDLEARLKETEASIVKQQILAETIRREAEESRIMEQYRLDEERRMVEYENDTQYAIVEDTNETNFKIEKTRSKAAVKISRHQRDSEIIRERVRAKTELTLMQMNLLREERLADTAVKKAYYDTMRNTVEKSLGTIKDMNKRGVSIKVNGTHGSMDVDIEIR